MTRFLRVNKRTENRRRGARSDTLGPLAALVLLSTSCDGRKPVETSPDDSPAAAVSPAENEKEEIAQAAPAPEPLLPVPPIEDSRSPQEWLASLQTAEEEGRKTDSGPQGPADIEDPNRPERTVESEETPARETIEAVRQVLEQAGFAPRSVAGGSQITGGKGELTLHKVEAHFAGDDGKRVLVFRLDDGGQEHAGAVFDEHFAPFTAAGYYIRLFDGPGERAARTNTFDRDLEAIAWQEKGVLVAAIGYVPADAERIHAAAVDAGLYGESD